MPLQAISEANQKRINQENPLFNQLQVGTILGQVVDAVLDIDVEAAAAGEAAAETLFAGAAKVVVKAGAAAEATVDLTTEDPASITAIFAVTTATGAFATKALLAATTDYTFSTTTNLLTCVTDQSAATLIIIYK